MIRICILLLSAVLAATAVGQTVAGRVVDDESGEALRFGKRLCQVVGERHINRF